MKLRADQQPVKVKSSNTGFVGCKTETTAPSRQRQPSTDVADERVCLGQFSEVFLPQSALVFPLCGQWLVRHLGQVYTEAGTKIGSHALAIFVPLE